MIKYDDRKFYNSILDKIYELNDTSNLQIKSEAKSNDPNIDISIKTKNIFDLFELDEKSIEIQQNEKPNEKQKECSIYLSQEINLIQPDFLQSPILNKQKKKNCIDPLTSFQNENKLNQLWIYGENSNETNWSKDKNLAYERNHCQKQIDSQVQQENNSPEILDINANLSEFKISKYNKRVRGCSQCSSTLQSNIKKWDCCFLPDSNNIILSSRNHSILDTKQESKNLPLFLIKKIDRQKKRNLKVRHRKIITEWAHTDENYYAKGMWK